MSKRPRSKGSELYHHIYNRGNDRQPLFKSKSDYERYLNALFKFAIKYKIEVIAYALMEWHIHLFIYDSSGKISQFMNVLHGWYAQIFNKINDRIGHVFEGRFKNKIVDANNYGLWLSRYIHRQSIEAGIIVDPKDFKWSSYRVYIGLDKNPLLKTDIILKQFGRDEAQQSAAYRHFVEGIEDSPIDWSKIEINSQSIIGDSDFVEQVKVRLYRKVEDEDTIDDPLIFISSHLNVPVEVLTHPQGREEKKLRRKAITTLGDKHGFGVRQLARLFRMSPSSVFAILTKREINTNNENSENS
ncbi:hypothetical protein AMJ52_02605 [candidate division TA06 bacterium DG_78]|uniref:Transposase IS200-like domain-containing protein n=1 Tax=candidate division TA06 bacterium DG_78 TaxID=1703772 RepID=A0A0S7YH62_UNCT6|nr:MAG: hypothetical protein AMJ52_02605 [candidate division TA06 bacterium DG_78]